MRKNVIRWILLALVLIAASVVLRYWIYSDKPFETMNTNDIEEIKVYAIPPDAEVVLDEAEAEKCLCFYKIWK